jgi:hypothetical protein
MHKWQRLQWFNASANTPRNVCVPLLQCSKGSGAKALLCEAAVMCCVMPHLLPGGPNAAEGSITCRPLGFLMAGGSSDHAASARCAALKYNV